MQPMRMAMCSTTLSPTTAHTFAQHSSEVVGCWRRATSDLSSRWEANRRPLWQLWLEVFRAHRRGCIFDLTWTKPIQPSWQSRLGIGMHRFTVML